MALQHAVLAILDDGPSYGWDLKASFERAVGPQWGLNVGHLYQVLDRLRRDGLATAEVLSQADRPDRTVYRITAQGRAELDSWLDSAVNRTRGYRDDFFLKVMAGARRDPAALAHVIDVQRQRYLQELRSLSELPATPRDVITKMIIQAATLHTQADLRIVDLAEERTQQLLDEAATTRLARAQKAPGPSASKTAPETAERPRPGQQTMSA